MTPELDQFLTDLGGRRERLLQLIPSSDDPTRFTEELTELAEQLIIAEEELRVQQEEMAAGVSRMAALVEEREELRNSAAQPYLLTDWRGVVLWANPAAGALIRQPAVRPTPRPIATWFEVADRPTIRTMISRICSGQEHRSDAGAMLRRSDRSTLPVRVTVTATPGTDPQQLELLWRLEAEPVPTAPAAQRSTQADRGLALADQSASLRLVAGPAADASAGFDLASELSAVAVELARCETEDDLLAIGVERLRRLIPAAHHAGVLLLSSRGKIDETTSAGAEMPVFLQRELELREGPALTALAERSPELVTDTADELRWTGFAPAVAELGIRSVLSVELVARDTALGALSLYAEGPNAFDSAAVSIASMLAVHLGLALQQLRTVRNLQAGMSNRGVIGEAIGVLMERHKLTSQRAYQLLVQASQRNNVKLSVVAQILSETGQEPSALRTR